MASRELYKTRRVALGQVGFGPLRLLDARICVDVGARVDVHGLLRARVYQYATVPLRLLSKKTQRARLHSQQWSTGGKSRGKPSFGHPSAAQQDRARQRLVRLLRLDS